MRAMLLLLALSGAASAETLVAARTLRSQTILGAGDLSQIDGATPGAFSDPSEVIGQETRVVIYAGRPIRTTDIGPAALIDRNQIVTLLFRRGVLEISTEGRALARGGVGDVVRVMNIASRSTVTGIVGADGVVRVSAGDGS